MNVNVASLDMQAYVMSYFVLDSPSGVLTEKKHSDMPYDHVESNPCNCNMCEIFVQQQIYFSYGHNSSFPLFALANGNLKDFMFFQETSCL